MKTESITESTTTADSIGGVYCPYCGSKMIYHPKYGWLCPKCSIIPKD